MRLLSGFAAAILLGVVGLLASMTLFTKAVVDIKGAASFDARPRIVLPTLAEKSTLFDARGGAMGELFGDENRKQVTLAQVSPKLISAVLAVEDNNFYEHNGVNLGAILRAFKANSDAGRTVQGGSTITQQLVKNSLTGNERSISRKVREAALAVQLENQLCADSETKACKDQILEQYLNTIYLGRGSYGVEAASSVYFGTTAANLDWPQAALLAAMIRNPTGYDPVRFPNLARERRRIVTLRLTAEKIIDAATAAAINEAPLPTTAAQADSGNSDVRLAEVPRRVRDEILDAELPGLTRVGATRELRSRLLFTGGLKVYTTWDPVAQQYADAAVAENPVAPANPGVAAALVAVEPSTGGVKAIVGETRGADGKPVELADPSRGGRSPGSSFKTFTLLTAYMKGYVPTDTVGATPVPNRELSPELVEKNPKGWPTCSHGDKPSPTSMTIEKATAESSNCAFVRLHEVVGDAEVIKTAAAMGITINPTDAGDWKPGTAIARPLGSHAPVTPLQMASAYGVLANDGRRNAPHFVSRIEDSAGNEIYRYQPANAQVVDREAARLTTESLREVVADGTATAAQIRGREIAGKTGTNEDENGDNKDLWFVGYTPEIAVAVWTGFPGEERGLVGSRTQGGRSSAVMWQKFVSSYLQGTSVERFNDPAPVRRGKFVKDPWTGRTSAAPASSASSRPRSTTTTTTPASSSSGAGDGSGDGSGGAAGEAGSSTTSGTG